MSNVKKNSTLTKRQEFLLQSEQVLSIVVKDNDERFDLNTSIAWQPNGTKIEILIPVTNELEGTKDYVKSILSNLIELVPFSNLAGREDELEHCTRIYSSLLKEAIEFAQRYFDGSNANMSLFTNDGVSIRIELSPRTFMDRNDI